MLDVFGPEPVSAPPADWYEAALPRAAYVYPDHGRLWFTAKALRERGCFRVPDDLRPLVESVYGPFEAGRESALGELAQRSILAQGEERADESAALRNALSVSAGYGTGEAAWSGEVNTPTRLGEPTNIVRLCIARSGAWEPWSQATRHPWQKSEIRVNAQQIAAEWDADAAEIERLKSNMPDQGKWCLALLLRPSDGEFRAHAVGQGGRLATWIYDDKHGLRRKEDENSK